jgi:hypothetical protein
MAPKTPTDAYGRLRRDGFTTSWLAARLGTQPERVDLARRDGWILGVRVPGTHDYYFPAWQFDREGQPLPVVRRVIEAARARGLNDERLFEILSTRAGLVGGKPLAQGVQDGDEEQLLAAVRSARP